MKSSAYLAHQKNQRYEFNDGTSLRYTIIICTFNRASLLEKALNALLEQTFGREEFSVVVVDNNSSDETPRVVESFSNRGLRIKYVFEERQGIAFARNRGAREADTEYFLYLDDDAVAAPDWLAAFDAFNASTNREYDCVAGFVSLDWSGGSRPDWLPSKYEPLLSGYDLGPAVLDLTEDNYLLTVNVAFKRSSFVDLKGFREDLGRVGGSLISGEDVDLLHRLIRSGCRVGYLPSMRVTHFVSLMRQKRSWLMKRLFWDGATQPYLDYGPLFDNVKKIERHLLYDLKMLGYFIVTSPFKSENRWMVFQRLGRIASEMKIIAGMRAKRISARDKSVIGL
jgi:glycosyltransferase involved in cell wall biosynthesis